MPNPSAFKKTVFQSTEWKTVFFSIIAADASPFYGASKRCQLSLLIVSALKNGWSVFKQRATLAGNALLARALTMHSAEHCLTAASSVQSAELQNDKAILKFGEYNYKCESTAGNDLLPEKQLGCVVFARPTYGTLHAQVCRSLAATGDLLCPFTK